MYMHSIRYSWRNYESFNRGSRTDLSWWCCAVGVQDVVAHEQNAFAKRRRDERMQQIMRIGRTAGDVTPHHDVTARQRASPLPAATPVDKHGGRCHGDDKRQQRYDDPDETCVRLATVSASPSTLAISPSFSGC